MKRIFLVGYMGSGKTTVGQMLAKHYGYSFIDLDTYIENRMMKKINNIFSEMGEGKFREIEQRMLQEVSEMENIVVSTGGGAACFFNNMELMNESGVCIYLRLTVDNLAQRLYKARASRPLIKDKTIEELPVFVAEMLAQREPFYNKAMIVVDNNVNNPSEIERIIIDRISQLKTT